MKLDAAVIEGFQKVYLWEQFDRPAEPAALHREMWEVCCSDATHIAFAAPRKHAKSSAITHTYTLAMMLFRIRDYALLVSDTEGQAVKFLQDIRTELTENEHLIRDFGIARLVKDTETEIVVQCNDGYLFNLTARGSEQKVRGLKWRNKRPNFIMIDDFENDELVMNPDRRKKLKKWFLNALLQCGTDGDYTLFRMVGTILHFDSILENLMKDASWTTRRYKAHESFNDFSNLLWPERHTEESLRKIRQTFINQGETDGYSQEYLSQPISSENGYFREGDFLDYDPDEGLGPVLYYVGLDLAVTTKQSSDWSVAMVIAINPEGYISVVDVIRKRVDSVGIVKMILDLYDEYAQDDKPIEAFVSEKGIINASIGPFLEVEMVRRNLYPTMEVVPCAADKTMRAKSIQGRMRAKNVRWDTAAEWFPDLKQEYLQFPRGKNDDQVDAFSALGIHLAGAARPQSDEDSDEEEYQRHSRQHVRSGQSRVTGY